MLRGDRLLYKNGARLDLTCDLHKIRLIWICRFCAIDFELTDPKTGHFDVSIIFLMM